MYTVDELEKILRRSARILAVTADGESVFEMAKRSRGTPRVANRILKRVRDFCQVEGRSSIGMEITEKALTALGVDEMGLEGLDREILRVIIERFKGGPVGIDTISAAIGEERVTIEDVYEPYLIQAGFLHRTQKGRVVSDLAYLHLGISVAGEQITI
jgi:Holliday junction DNA helicase RuvB